MSSARRQPVDLQSLVNVCNEWLRDFDHRAVLSLDRTGTWEYTGRNIRDRISNELWFSVWQYQQQGRARECLQQLLEPITAYEEVYRGGLRMRGITMGSEDTVAASLAVLDVLYSLIEYHVHETISSRYVPEWDYQGDALRTSSLMRKQEIENDLYTIFGQRSTFDRFLGIMTSMQDTGYGICESVIGVISEEERVLNQVGDIVTQRGDTAGKENMLSVLSEHVILSLNNLTDNKKALLRTCMEVLLNRDIAVATGLQYEASSILSAVRDPRSTETLMKALALFGPEYTNIRCNLIYTLGTLAAPEAVEIMIDTIRGPDYADVYPGSGGTAYKQTLNWEKREAIWGIGKCGIHGLKALDALAARITCTDRESCIALAWTLSQIGNAQRKKSGGIDAVIMTLLMRLLTHDDPAVFEEVACGLRVLELPDFLHALYLHNIKTLPVLSLKPSNEGLYELSETILHLVSVRQPVVMAVTGDSGTGKTYFSNAIIDGFGEIDKNDIAYFMRDDPQDMYVFNRMLGIRLLKELRDPQHYEDYPCSEEDDDPHAYFADFMKRCAGKKLIILDGWMDRSYFYQVLKVFYARGYLDVMVNFRTSYSTKRFNLETRERRLDSVQTCLTYVEDPTLEDTPFYRNGDVLIYNLDNSSKSRLLSDEIREIFSRRKVGTWIDYIRIGAFEEVTKPLPVMHESIAPEREGIEVTAEPLGALPARALISSEAHFTRTIVEDEHDPYLLQTVRMPGIDISRIALYTQGQIAFSGNDGTVGILSGLNDRIFYAPVSTRRVPWLTVVGDSLFTVDENDRVGLSSFNEPSVTKLGQVDSPVSAIASERDHLVCTGHEDGTVMLWDMGTRRRLILGKRTAPVRAVAVDRRGTVHSGHDDGLLCVWYPDRSRLQTYAVRGAICHLEVFPDNRLVISVRSKKGRKSVAYLKILDTNTHAIVSAGPLDGEVTTMTPYLDDRVFAGVRMHEAGGVHSALVVCDTLSRSPNMGMIGMHGEEMKDCVVMGPRIITSSTDGAHGHLRIWGTARYVQTEREKLRLLTDTENKPSFYRTLF